jgi:hypothetical protein
VWQQRRSLGQGEQTTVIHKIDGLHVHTRPGARQVIHHLLVRLFVGDVRPATLDKQRRDSIAAYAQGQTRELVVIIHRACLQNAWYTTEQEQVMGVDRWVRTIWWHVRIGAHVSISSSPARRYIASIVISLARPAGVRST